MEHQEENSKQFRLSGNPACKKQEASCTLQAATALEQELGSLKGGRGLEHHFPHLYSQVGVGDTVTVDVQREAVVLVLVLVVVGGVVVGFEVVVQLVDDDDDDEVFVVVAVELDDDDEDGGGALQGSVDSKSFAT